MCALTRRAADVLGTTQTGAIERALEELLERHDEERRVAREREAQQRYDAAMAVLDQMRARLTPEDIEAMKRDMEDMYDEHGLPR